MSALAGDEDMTHAIRFAVAAMVAAVAPIAHAEEATDVLNSLYGEELKRVAATPTPADDVALARRLLEAAKAAEKQPAFLTLLCEKAHELAIKDPSGYPTALAAMELLAAKVPEKKNDCLQKSVVVYQRQYATARGDEKTKAGETLIQAFASAAETLGSAGDYDAAAMMLRQALGVAGAIRSDSRTAIQAQLTALAVRQQTEKQLAALKAKLEANPQDDASRQELIRLYLVELDNPAEAAPLINDRCDAATRRYVPAAAKAVDEAPELACQELGKWYQGLADQAAGAGAKAAMLHRARAYYGRFLELHTAEDLARTATTLTLKKIDDALEKLGPVALPGAAPAGWTDCLRLIDPAKHTEGGKTELKGGALYLVGDPLSAIITVPVAPQGSYEMQVTFARTAGTGKFGVWLPVGTGACKLVLAVNNGALSGLDGINGKPVEESEAVVRPGTLVNNQEYVLGLKVSVRGTEAAVTVDLGARPYLRWQGPVSAVAGPKPWPRHDPTYLGIGIESGSAAVLRRVRFRPLPGEAKLPALPTAAGPWTDCLEAVDLAKNVVAGKWGVKDGCLSNTSWGRVSLPVAPQGSYEMQVSFVRTAGDSTVTVCLPVGPSACALVLSASAGTASGLEFINSNSVTKGTEGCVRPGTLVSGKEYSLNIKVLLRADQAEVATELDGKPLVRWQGPVSALSNQAWGLPDPKYVGVGAINPTVFRRILVRNLPADAGSAAGATTSPAKPEPKPPAAPAAEKGWTVLFNGTDLAGWQNLGGTWEVEPGGILVGKAGGNLATVGRCRDFALDLEFNLERGANSGVFFRVENPNAPAITGLEVQVADILGPALRPDKGSCGALYDMLAPSKLAAKPAGQWNRLQVAAKGSRIQVVLNGETVIDTDLAMWTQHGRNPDGSSNRLVKIGKDMTHDGCIVLQRLTGTARFRNIRVKPL